MDFGLGEAVSKFLSEFIVENNKKGYKDFLGITLKLYILIDLIIFVVFTLIYFLADKIYIELSDVELAKFKVIFLITALYSIFSFIFKPLDGILIAHEKFVAQKTINLLYKVINVISIAMVLLFGYGLYALVLVNVLTGIIAILFKLGYIKYRDLLLFHINTNDTTLYKQLFKFSIWTTIIAISQRFIINITPTILAAFSGTDQVSIFSIGSSIEGYVWTFANALNGLFLPSVTKIISNPKNGKNLEILMIKVGRIQLIILGLLIIGFIILGKEFMIIWIGKDFINSYYVAMLLILPSIITLTQHIGVTALVVKNEIKYRAISYLITAIISFSLSIDLSKSFGAIGSAIAIFIGNIIGQVIVLNFVFKSKLSSNFFKNVNPIFYDFNYWNLSTKQISYFKYIHIFI